MRSTDGLVGTGVGDGSLCVPSEAVRKVMFVYLSRKGSYGPLQLLKEAYGLTLLNEREGR